MMQSVTVDIPSPESPIVVIDQIIGMSSMEVESYRYLLATKGSILCMIPPEMKEITPFVYYSAAHKIQRVCNRFDDCSSEILDLAKNYYKTCDEYLSHILSQLT
jgi:hypothetical protein